MTKMATVVQEALNLMAGHTGLYQRATAELDVLVEIACAAREVALDSPARVSGLPQLISALERFDFDRSGQP